MKGLQRMFEDCYKEEVQNDTLQEAYVSFARLPERMSLILCRQLRERYR